MLDSETLILNGDNLNLGLRFPESNGIKILVREKEPMYVLPSAVSIMRNAHARIFENIKLTVKPPMHLPMVLQR